MDCLTKIQKLLFKGSLKYFKEISRNNSLQSDNHKKGKYLTERPKFLKQYTPYALRKSGTETYADIPYSMT